MYIGNISKSCRFRTLTLPSLKPLHPLTNTPPTTIKNLFKKDKDKEKAKRLAADKRLDQSEIDRIMREQKLEAEEMERMRAREREEDTMKNMEKKEYDEELR